MFDFLSLKKTLSSFSSELGDLRTQIESHQRQIEDIVNAPATREDVKAMVTRWAAGKSGEYVKRLQFNLHEFICHPKNLQNEAAVESRMTLFGKSRQQGALGMFPGPELEDMAICCLMGPAVVAAMHAAIDAMQDWPEGAVPFAGRDKAISDLDNKLAALVKKEASLVSSAEEAGVRLN